MTETTMPTAEATVAGGSDERNSYEFAFHVLPTVVEGEVAGVFDGLKAHITKAGGEMFDEEMPERIDLAYEITKSIDGTNRRFTSAYFGWVRFKLASDKIEDLMEELEHDKNVLRTLMVKLTKAEEEHPFRFHEHRKSQKKTDVVGDDVVATDEVVEEEKTESTEETEDSEVKE